MGTSKGACRYCGQIHMLNEEYDLMEDADLEATLACNCPEAMTFQYRRNRKSKILSQINKWDEIYREPAEILTTLIDKVNEEKVKKITVNDKNKGKFSLEITAKGELKLKKETKQVEEATT